MPAESEGFYYWKLTLTAAERIEVDHVINNLHGDFADAYIAVKIMRLEQRSALRVGLKEVATIGSAILAALGATRLPNIS